MSDVPSLEEIIEDGVEAALGRVETAQIGTVTAFNAQNHTVSVQPVHMKKYEREDGGFSWVKQPIIPNVPIWFFGSSEARVVFPIEPGSTVLLVHLSESKTAWQFSQQGVTMISDDQRKHSLTDCVAIPGGLTVSTAAKQFSRGSSKIIGDTLTIHTPGKIRLGGGLVVSPVAMKTDLQMINAALATASAALNTLGVSGAPGKIAVDAIITALNALNFPVCSSVTETE